MRKKIGVIAGTKIDTLRGVELVQTSFDYEIISCSIADTPREQNNFQFSPKKEKEARIHAVLTDLVKSNVEVVLVYCNSLSASIDFDHFSEMFNIPIITPFSYYRLLAKNYQHLGILSANSQGAKGIETVLNQENPVLNISTLTHLKWVEQIELNETPENIFEKNGLKEALEFLKVCKVDAVILGCTHFPYLLSIIEEKTTVKCLTPEPFLIEQIQKAFREDK